MVSDAFKHPATEVRARMTLPLANVRVLDFGQGAAGPYCGQLLGDYGADVIKVEPPRGDWGRTMGVVDERTGTSSVYISMNRNKRGLCLDLSKEKGVSIARSLTEKMDVVLESFRPGVMDRLGLGYEDIVLKNAAVVYCSINGFGSSGPKIDLPASDSLMQPYGGLMSVVGEPDRPPLKVGNIVSDMIAATNAFSAILLGLIQRSVTGEGSHVEVSLLDSIVAFQTTGLTQYLMTGKAPQRLGNRHPLLSTSGVIQASDGYVTFAVLDHHWDAFCQKVGDDELTSDVRFATSQDRLVNRDALWGVFERIFAQRTIAEWIEMLNAIDIVCGPVNDYPAVVADAQVKHNRLFESCTLESGVEVPMVRNPIRMNDVPVTYSRPPRLGEHSRAILSIDLGMSDEETDRAVGEGVVVIGS